MKLRIGLILLSSFSIIIGITIKTKLYYKEYNINKKEHNNIVNYIKNNDSSNYISVLEIPKINLKKGIKINTNVDEGISIIDIDKFNKGDIILASHSGECNTCFFKYLDKLELNDLIYLYKDNVKYIYKIESIDEKIKNTFKLDDNIDTITLITCKKYTNDIQIIIKGKLIRKEKY